MVEKVYTVDNYQMRIHASANTIRALLALVKTISGRVFKYVGGYLVEGNTRLKVITSYMLIEESRNLILGAGQVKSVKATADALINKKEVATA